ncbi:MAG: sialidase family protein [Acidobacteriota bacterium]
MSPNNARSESSIVIDPKNPLHMVAGSKEFTDPANYVFTLATSYSVDGGHTWSPSGPLQLLSGWVSLTDPAMAWDDAHHVYLVGLALGPNLTSIGIAVYKSLDGGKTWGMPQVIHTGSGDDKQWAAGDRNSGRVYAVWDDGSTLRFARTLDHGATWVGTGPKTSPQPAGSALANDSFSPDIEVAPNGDVYIAWLAGATIKLIVSTDGGDTFSPLAPAATGITTLSPATLPTLDGWPVLPGGTFRVLTLPSLSVGPGSKELTVAWADMREGASRIYHAQSHNGGQIWATPATGKPLLSHAISPALHHFHPQTCVGPNGFIGCAFYEFGPKPTTPKIDTMLATSHDHGATWTASVVTDHPWDPTIDAPHADGLPSARFIGDYFGLDASFMGFYPLWTDTRTGIQELFTQRVIAKSKSAFNPNLGAIVAQILFGIVNDSSGVEIVGGHLVHVGPGPDDPEGPIRDILAGLATYQLAGAIGDAREAQALQQAAMESVGRLVQRQLQGLGAAHATAGNGERVRAQIAVRGTAPAPAS